MFFLKIASVFGALAVISGAFGAHKLKSMLDAAQLDVWNKAVSYQFYHVAALLTVGILFLVLNNEDLKFLNYSGWCFIIGTLFFSGSLYLIALRNVLGLDSLMSVLGPITPTGGLFFIAGWILLFLQILKFKA